MYRRRRITRPIAFGFDSFLDLVANVIGIIIRLILVAWVGGRSYQALMQWRADPPDEDAQAIVLPKREDDPLAAEIARWQRELEAARAALLEQIEQLDLKRQHQLAQQQRLEELTAAQEKLQTQEKRLADGRSQHEDAARLASLSLEELRRRQVELRQSLKNIEAVPATKKLLRYHTPVSRGVHADEVFFECNAGRVTFVDLPAFLQEVQAGLEAKAQQLRTSYKLVEHTAPVGAFRLRYVIERQREGLDEMVGAAKPRTMFNFRYGVSEWTVEPIATPRGEELAEALAAGSAFRRLVESLDATTVVTLWVYPDSFPLYRALRDFCYERGLEVAGRPLPRGAAIAASRHGSASRGQ